MMTYVCDDSLLYKAQISLAWMFEYGVNQYGYALEDFYDRFLASGIAQRFAENDPAIVAGRSGGELAYEVLERTEPGIHPIGQIFTMERSREYWVGYALAYYQRQKNLNFDDITKKVPISEIQKMYYLYHEMDLTHFVLEMDRRMEEQKKENHSFGGGVVL